MDQNKRMENVELVLMQYDTIYGGIYLKRIQLHELQEFVGRVMLLNAAVLRPNMYAWTFQADWATARAIVKYATENGIQVQSYIGHESTANLLTSLLGIPITANRGLYQPDSGDLALVFRLRGRRPVSEATSVSPEDFEIFYVHYLV